MKERIEEKLRALEKQRAQLVADINATDGAIQICKQLLEEEIECSKITIKEQ